jgi:hypothetical protein
VVHAWNAGAHCLAISAGAFTAPNVLYISASQEAFAWMQSACVGASPAEACCGAAETNAATVAMAASNSFICSSDVLPSRLTTRAFAHQGGG